MSRELPAKPNLEHLKKQAKQLLHNVRLGDPDAVERFRTLGPVPAADSPDLSDAQHAIAREYGFASWPKLKEHVDAMARALVPAELLARAVCDSDAGKVARILEEHAFLRERLNEPMANYGGMQALLAAVQRSDRRTIDVLLAAGADIHARSRSWLPGIGVLDECAPEMARVFDGARGCGGCSCRGSPGNAGEAAGVGGGGRGGGPCAWSEWVDALALRLHIGNCGVPAGPWRGDGCAGLAA